MKASIFLSMALASLAVAAPLNKRAYVTRTVIEEVVETVEITTTIWVDATPASATVVTTTSQAAAAFFEKPVSSKAAAVTSQAAASSSSIPAPAPSSSSVEVYTPPPVVSTPSPTPVYTPPPAAATSVVTPVQEEPVYTPTPVVSTPASTPSAPASGGSGTYTGELTWYDTGMGSCGQTSGPNEKIVAVSHVIMTPKNGANPNTNPLCGKKVKITYGGKTMEGTIVDTCPGCAEGDLDLSKGFFDELTNYGDGRVHGATWDFV